MMTIEYNDELEFQTESLQNEIDEAMIKVVPNIQVQKIAKEFLHEAVEKEVPRGKAIRMVRSFTEALDVEVQDSFYTKIFDLKFEHTSLVPFRPLPSADPAAHLTALLETLASTAADQKDVMIKALNRAHRLGIPKDSALAAILTYVEERFGPMPDHLIPEPLANGVYASSVMPKGS